MLLIKARDRGAALVTTLALGMVMLLLVASALSAVNSGSAAVRTSQDSTGALDAAYAGVQDYLVRLNGNPTYLKYGNPASSFTSRSGSSVTAPPTVNPAFGLGPTVGSPANWAAVPGSANAFYRYEVDNHSFSSAGVVRVRVTGRVGRSTRSLVTTIHQQGFTGYIYFTDVEVLDPSITNQSTTGCSKYLYSGRVDVDSRNNRLCTPVYFGNSDVLSGPVHSNDTIRSCGTVFTTTVGTGDPAGQIVKSDGCSGNATAVGSKGGKFEGTFGLPQSNSAMQTQTDRGTTNSPGCLYTGPTTITLLSNGNMKVVSPWTVHTVTNGAGFDDGYATQCGAISQLNSPSGATVPVPSGNLVYVQNVPTNSSDPNYPKNGIPPNFACYNSGGTGATANKLSNASGSGGWWYGSSSTTLRHPLNNEYPANGWQSASDPSKWDTSDPAYGCTSGDAFVEGTATGQLSIAAANNLYVTGDITYGNSSTDLLGLVATKYLVYYNPMRLTGSDRNGNPTYTSMLGDTDRTVQACLLATGHVVLAQNWDRGGTRGILNVYGSIAQRYRGSVATGDGNGNVSNGYAKNYQYDQRLASVSPPYFITPSIASFKAASYASTRPAFDVNGN